jgi:RHS repeat-associated protein
MTSDTGTRHFVYDPDGRVIGEYGASAADVKAEFIWALPEVANDNTFGGDDGAGGYMPLAVATPDSGGSIVINWVHGNHLGVPIVTTDASGNAATTPNDYLAPGFPGQSRTLADLYYNRYRDYDPTTGRYIQADPIGLAGGQNDYAYVENNPIKNIDPMGLQVAIPLPVCGAGPIGAAACAGGLALSYCLITPACRDALRPPGNPPRNPPRDFPKPTCKDDDGDDSCVKGWDREANGYCVATFRGEARRRCRRRAADRLRACRREGGHWPPSGPDRWSYQDERRFRP